MEKNMNPEQETETTPENVEVNVEVTETPATPATAASTTETPATPATTPEEKDEPAQPVKVQDLLSQHPELQAFLDSKIGEARKKGRESGKADLLKSLGTEDQNDLKAIIEAEKARKEAEMTEVQRLEEKIKALETERDTAKQEREAYEERTRKALIQTEIREQARELNFNDIDDLVRLLDYTEVTVDLEESTVSGIKDQAKALAKQKPYLIKVATAKPNPAPATPQPATTDAKEKAKKEQNKDKAWKPSL
jgi:hypothetical protein